MNLVENPIVIGEQPREPDGLRSPQVRLLGEFIIGRIELQGLKEWFYVKANLLDEVGESIKYMLLEFKKSDLQRTRKGWNKFAKREGIFSVHFCSQAFYIKLQKQSIEASKHAAEK
jgi:hypothetical protein